MKKIALSVLVISALVFTSCKSEKKEVKELEKEVVKTEKVVKKEVKEVVEEIKKDLTSAIEGITIPNFSNESVTKNLVDYAQYAKNYIDAKGNIAKIKGMTAQGATLLIQGKELASKLDTSELTKYKSVLSEIQSKMASSN